MLLKHIILVISVLIVQISFTQGNKDLLIKYVNKDTAIAVASKRYEDRFHYKKILMGKNYRSTWATPVKLPVFNLSKSGFRIERLGGSKQTKSLYLRDQNNKQWVLRSVDKDVKQGLPKFLQYTPLKWYKQDLISADHPFAAVVVAHLVKEAGLIGPYPVIYFIPDDKALGAHQAVFANTIAMLEKVDLAPGNAGVFSTDSVSKQIHEKKNSVLAQKQYLKARIIDMLVGDWDRHEGNWLWWRVDSGGKRYYNPIPRDRDHALFFSRGFFPTIMKYTAERQLTGFKKKSTGLRGLNKKARHLDKSFLKGLTKMDWINVTVAVQNEITDSMIETAVNKLPPEIIALDGKAIREKLISRRNSLLENILKYYKFISEDKY